MKSALELTWQPVKPPHDAATTNAAFFSAWLHDNAPFFAGHFPGGPYLVPAFVQVAWFSDICQQVAPNPQHPGFQLSLDRCKFSAPIPPERQLVVRIETQPTGNATEAMPDDTSPPLKYSVKLFSLDSDSKEAADSAHAQIDAEAWASKTTHCEAKVSLVPAQMVTPAAGNSPPREIRL